jgi:serine/threonine protein kinase
MGAEAEGLDFDQTIPGVPRAGERIDDKYEIETVIGEGAMGIVFVARHLKLDERVAIKILKPEVVRAAPTLVERFLREARAAISIRSAHVVRVMDVGTLASGAPFMVMEYLEGRDLQSLLQEKGALSINEAAEYVVQACDAMAEAHARGIVHRDLKPANLFLTQRFDGTPWIKVLDFGISKAVARDSVDPEVSLTQTAAILGSPAYMSPEQVRNAKTVDARADVWSLGVILYKLLAGGAPFEGSTFSSLCAAIVADDPTPIRDKRPDVPAELEAIVMRCLAKKADARYQRVEELAMALRPFAAGDYAAPPSAPDTQRGMIEPTVDQAQPAATADVARKSRGALWIGVALAAVVSGVLIVPRLMPAPSTPEPTTTPSIAESPAPVVIPPVVTATVAPPPPIDPPVASAIVAPPTKPGVKVAAKPSASVAPSASALQVTPPPAPSKVPDPLEHAQ